MAPVTLHTTDITFYSTPPGQNTPLFFSYFFFFFTLSQVHTSSPEIAETKSHAQKADPSVTIH